MPSHPAVFALPLQRHVLYHAVYTRPEGRHDTTGAPDWHVSPCAPPNTIAYMSNVQNTLNNLAGRAAGSCKRQFLQYCCNGTPFKIHSFQGPSTLLYPPIAQRASTLLEIIRHTGRPYNEAPLPNTAARSPARVMCTPARMRIAARSEHTISSM